MFWKASKYTGSLPVNYSVKLCVNESYAKHNGDCRWSSNPDCRPVHVLSTNKDFFCVLQEAKDFVSPCEKTCDYTISVIATNDVGSATSWTYLPFIPSYSGNAHSSGKYINIFLCMSVRVNQLLVQLCCVPLDKLLH